MKPPITEVTACCSMSYRARIPLCGLLQAKLAMQSALSVCLYDIVEHARRLFGAVNGFCDSFKLPYPRRERVPEIGGRGLGRVPKALGSSCSNPWRIRCKSTIVGPNPSLDPIPGQSHSVGLFSKRIRSQQPYRGRTMTTWDIDLKGIHKDVAADPTKLVHVLAGPGTGKTFAMMRRVARLSRREYPGEDLGGHIHTHGGAGSSGAVGKARRSGR